ncbi:hypothetical protein ASD25_13275 [Brevundimonas sp. Root1423]|nr:hypothetical protein ASD25_13275 [Brevundimonas sp. Root1423]
MHPVAAHDGVFPQRQPIRRTVAAHPPVPVPERHTHVGGDPALHVPHHGQRRRRRPQSVRAAAARHAAALGVGRAEDQQRPPRPAQSLDLRPQQGFIGGGVQSVLEPLVDAERQYDEIGLCQPRRARPVCKGLQRGADDPDFRQRDTPPLLCADIAEPSLKARANPSGDPSAGCMAVPELDDAHGPDALPRLGIGQGAEERRQRVRLTQSAGADGHAGGQPLKRQIRNLLGFDPGRNRPQSGRDDRPPALHSQRAEAGAATADTAGDRSSPASRFSRAATGALMRR